MEEKPRSLSRFQRWVMAARPKTLTAAISPVLLGWSIALSTSRFHFGAALAALVTAVFIQIATNLVNDVVDFYKGADTAERAGPTRVTETGLLTPQQVWTGVVVSFGAAALAGVYLYWVAGWPVLVLGAASILAGIAYTAGPYPLAYNGLGDLFVLLFFGYVAVGGTVFVTAGAFPPIAWYGGTAAGALTVNILVVNNIRDIESDRKAGRKNLPVVFGRWAAVWQYGILLVVAYLVPLILIFQQLTSPWVLLSFLTIPQAVKLLQVLRSGQSGASLNPTLGQTAQLLLRYCILLAIGLLL
ncbi:MAG: 1,4-dihydroxy-2-naphthoate polyprenyltransferase [Anaerolineales bacterium]